MAEIKQASEEVQSLTSDQKKNINSLIDNIRAAWRPTRLGGPLSLAERRSEIAEIRRLTAYLTDTQTDKKTFEPTQGIKFAGRIARLLVDNPREPVVENGSTTSSFRNSVDKLRQEPKIPSSSPEIISSRPTKEKDPLLEQEESIVQNTTSPPPNTPPPSSSSRYGLFNHDEHKSTSPTKIPRLPLEDGDTDDDNNSIDGDTRPDPIHQ
jgi:hypothetical protein